MPLKKVDSKTLARLKKRIADLTARAPHKKKMALKKAIKRSKSKA